VAMLITPASTALLLSDKLNRVLIISSLIGFLSAVSGMILSIQYDATPGPMMAVMAAFFYALAVFFSPKKGLVFKTLRNKKLRNKIHLEDTLKQAFRLQQKGKLTFKNLQEQLGYNTNLLKKNLNKMARKNIVLLTPELALTDGGQAQANKLIRAHRLWETYLVEKMGLSEEQIHEEAEKYEHLLTDEMVNEVDRSLGFPSKDPHGSPIPLLKGAPTHPLSNMEIGQSARIDDLQIDEHVRAELWQRGILPDQVFVLKDITASKLQLIIGDREIELPKRMAERVNIEQIS